ncbi:MAG: signal peptidase I [Oscillospiraceae bacterium]|nr:signal peptidase I [Oscillospiraceae bacterium]
MMNQENQGEFRDPPEKRPEEKKEPSLTPAESVKVEFYFWLQALVLALVCIILVFTFVGRMIGVEGSSMVPTLHDNDMLLLQSVGYHPKQGDIVVLTKKSFLNLPIVKRVIAVGGQKVDMDYGTGTVRVDGTVLNEDYINGKMQPPSYQSISSVYVPQGYVFVMGDNRNFSSDSRDPQLGVVDERYILGRALFVAFPFSRLGTSFT